MTNNPGPDVPKRAPDARTQRTHQALSAALVALMLDRDFADITVQDVLDRAGVRRSTFYAHFRNKHDLLFSDAERFIGMLEEYFARAAEGTTRVAPLGELASHVGAYSAFVAALERSGQADAMWDLFVGHFARIIERRLGLLAPARPDDALPREVGARVLAAAAISLLQWWMTRGAPVSPEELDGRVHLMVWRGVSGGSSHRAAHGPAAGDSVAPLTSAE